MKIKDNRILFHQILVGEVFSVSHGTERYMKTEAILDSNGDKFRAIGLYDGSHLSIEDGTQCVVFTNATLTLEP